MAGLETDLEERVCNDALRLYGVLNLKLNGRGNTGYPDRIFWIPGGEPLLIEFKLPDEDPRKRQNLVHAQLLYKGYDVQVHDTYEEAIAAIRKALDTARPPDAGRQLLARSLFSSLIPGPGAGKNKYRLRGNKGSAA